MDIENLLRLLNENNVEYVIIGATAFPVHGYSRSTLDLDIFIRPTGSNAFRTLKALNEFGYDVTDISVKELVSKKILIRQYSVETDIHPFVKGVGFDEIWVNKVAGRIGNVSAYFASLEDLITMKRAAGRSKDQEDLKILRKIQERKREKEKGR